MPAYKPRPSLSSKLPEPLRKGIDLFFPPDDVIGPAMPGTAVVSGPSRSLIQALAPLTKGSLRRGQELAAELGQRLPTANPNRRPHSRVPFIDEFLKAISRKPEAPDPLKLLAQDKVTNSRPPKPSSVKLPEGFSFAGQPTLKQDPKITALDDVWSKFEKHSSKIPIKSFDRPAISGRWNNRSVNRSHQSRALKKNLQKP